MTTQLCPSTDMGDFRPANACLHVPFRVIGLTSPMPSGTRKRCLAAPTFPRRVPGLPQQSELFALLAAVACAARLQRRPAARWGDYTSVNVAFCKNTSDRVPSAQFYS